MRSQNLISPKYRCATIEPKTIGIEMDKTLYELVLIHGSVKAACRKIETSTGVDIPYTTFNHWCNGRIDLTFLERAIAVKKFFHLSDDEFLEMMQNSHSVD